MSTGWSTGEPVLSATRIRSSLIHGPIFGSGWTSRSYSNDAAPDRSILRTIFPKTFSSRQIALIGLP